MKCAPGLDFSGWEGLVSLVSVDGGVKEACLYTPGLAEGLRREAVVITRGETDRITDVDSIPSPYLTGLFDSFAAGPGRAAMIETNRGCPYGCTFCDWGSATLSRVRKFDLQRVFDELEWAAKNRLETVAIADFKGTAEVVLRF